MITEERAAQLARVYDDAIECLDEAALLIDEQNFEDAIRALDDVVRAAIILAADAVGQKGDLENERRRKGA